MARHADQLFIRTDDMKAVESALRSYVAGHANAFRPHTSVPLNGVQQVLTNLIKRRRCFLLYSDREWVVIWEKVQDDDFADPGVAAYIATELLTETIRVQVNEDYNIWVYQVFGPSGVMDECFLPETYFRGDPDSASRHEYGFCFDVAEEFNSSRKLPAFLMSLAQLDRNRSRYPDVKKVTCHIG